MRASPVPAVRAVFVLVALRGRTDSRDRAAFRYRITVREIAG